jgi:hypothetical protein
MTTNEPSGGEANDRQMRHVDHTPPHGDGAGAVWERGGEAGPDVDGDGDAEADHERVGAVDE